MKYLNTYYPECRFGGFADVDGSLTFYLRVNALLKPSFTVLDIGCGRGAWAEDSVTIRRDMRTLQGKCSKVIGIDVDPLAAQNSFIDEFRLIEDQWPISDASIDLCVSYNVLEHIKDPSHFFSESRRVLKKGGYLCIRTTNVMSYVGIASRLVPNRLHSKVVGHAQKDRKEGDVFPTVYRCNTVGALKKTLRKFDFDGVVYGHENAPGYFAFSRLLYFLGVLHQRHAPSIIKPSLFVFARNGRNVSSLDG